MTRWSGRVVAAVVGPLVLVGAAVTGAVVVDDAGRCGWLSGAVRLAQSLEGNTEPRTAGIRAELARQGITATTPTCDAAAEAGVADGIVVSPAGDDGSGTGSVDAPFKTLDKAQAVATPGSTVYLRGGVYSGKSVITTSGAVDRPITISSYPDERAILDGSGVSGSDPLLHLVDVHDVAIRDIEVRNSSGRGIHVQNSADIAITGTTVHEIEQAGIAASGDDIVIDGNEVYNACLTNTGGSYGSSGWPPAITTERRPDGTSSTTISITNNHVHDSWGEGIDAWFLNGGVVANDRSVDNFSVNIYVDDSRDIRVTDNFVASTSSAHNRADNGQPPTGIAFASETGSQAPTNMVVNGNILGEGLVEGIVHFTDGHGPITQGPAPQDF